VTVFTTADTAKNEQKIGSAENMEHETSAKRYFFVFHIPQNT